jgi:hypothetical protein
VPCGALRQKSAVLLNGQRALASTLGGCTAARILLDLKSASVDPYLIVVDRDTGTVHRNDDFAYGFDSQLLLPCTAGGYTVIATATVGSGPFELSATIPVTLRDLTPTSLTSWSSTAVRESCTQTTTAAAA